MKSRLAFGLVLLFAGGCQPPETPIIRPSTETPSTSTTPEATQASASTSPEVKNPNRVHQLDSLESVTLKANGKSFPAWVMDDDSKRAEGMMFLTESEVKPDEGMIFVFEEVRDASHGFWMHNTLLPLDIIYIGADGKVVSIAHGKPQDDTELPPKGSFQFVLELRGGGADRFGIKPGTTVEIPKGLVEKAN